MMNNKRKLGVKLLIGLAILAILVTTASIIVGARLYRKNTINRYNDFAYRISDLAANTFSTEELKFYSDKIKEYKAGEITLDELKALGDTPLYKEQMEKLDTIRVMMQVEDVLIYYMDPDDLVGYVREEARKLDYQPMAYILDSYYDSAGRVSIGDSWTVGDDYAAGMEKALRTGERYEGVIINDGVYGYTVTTVRPIFADGESIACVSVELPMSQLLSDIKEFRVFVSLAALITALIILVIISFIAMKIIIDPIVLVATEADSFITNNTKISDKLGIINTKDEIQALSESVLAMEIGINEYIDRLTKATAERERIGAELSVATRIQASALPSVFPAFPERKEFDLYATMEPAKEVGGDFYDFYLIDDDHIALEIADVSGKGVPAALFMMISKILLKNQAYFTISPSDVLTLVNNRLCENNEAEMFVTVWLGIFEISTGKLVAANAGHEYPFIKHKDGKFEVCKDQHGFVLAGIENAKYKEYEIQLEPGDTLFVYTDGVAEATNANNELFGLERTLKSLNVDPEGTPKDIIDNVQKGIDDFVQSAPQFDDITMLCFKYFGNDKV